MRTTILLLLLGGSLQVATAQDPFFIHFHNNKSHFNPALVGYRGALSFDFKFKQQWNQPNANAFQSATVAVEESLPCSLFDWGLFMHHDTEGAGQLETYEYGGKFAATFTTSSKRSKGIQNLRIGGKLQIARKQINFRDLIFSDQLDPKYGLNDRNGNPNSTNFLPPGDGIARNIFTPAIGLSYHILLDKKKKSSSIHLGTSIHHAHLSNNAPISTESLLVSTATTPRRFNAFVESELIFYSDKRHFWSVSPLLMWQRQSALNYFEVGTRLSWNRNLAFGVHYHFNEQADIVPNSNWVSLSAEIGSVVSKNHRVDIGVAWANTVSGLQNLVGPTWEVSLAWHLKSSPSCNLAGKGDEVPYSSKPICWVDGKRKKLYNNIWYRNNQ